MARVIPKVGDIVLFKFAGEPHAARVQAVQELPGTTYHQALVFFPPWEKDGFWIDNIAREFSIEIPYNKEPETTLGKLWRRIWL